MEPENVAYKQVSSCSGELREGNEVNRLGEPVNNGKDSVEGL